MSSKRFAFVLRLWNETSNREMNGPPELRGSVQMANSDQIVYFRSMEQIPKILRELTGWTDTTGVEPPVSD